MMNEKAKDRVEYPIHAPEEVPRRGRGDYIDLPDGSHIAPNGAVIEEPLNTVPEVLPPHEFTEEKEDLDLMIM